MAPREKKSASSRLARLKHELRAMATFDSPRALKNSEKLRLEIVELETLVRTRSVEAASRKSKAALILALKRRQKTQAKTKTAKGKANAVVTKALVANEERTASFLRFATQPPVGWSPSVVPFTPYGGEGGFNNDERTNLFATLFSDQKLQKAVKEALGLRGTQKKISFLTAKIRAKAIREGEYDEGAWARFKADHEEGQLPGATDEKEAKSERKRAASQRKKAKVTRKAKAKEDAAGKEPSAKRDIVVSETTPAPKKEEKTSKKTSKGKEEPTEAGVEEAGSVAAGSWLASLGVGTGSADEEREVDAQMEAYLSTMGSEDEEDVLMSKAFNDSDFEGDLEAEAAVSGVAEEEESSDEEEGLDTQSLSSNVHRIKENRRMRRLEKLRKDAAVLRGEEEKETIKLQRPFLIVPAMRVSEKARQKMMAAKKKIALQEEKEERARDIAKREAITAKKIADLKKKRAETLGESHPSWAARKAASGPVEFEGEAMSFDSDSE